MKYTIEQPTVLLLRATVLCIPPTAYSWDDALAVYGSGSVVRLCNVKQEEQLVS